MRKLGGLDILVSNAGIQQAKASIADVSFEQFDDTMKVNVYAPFLITKAANIAFVKCLAKQLARKGIRVNAVAPGPYWTPLQISGGQLPDDVSEFGSRAPMGRPGQPVEIAPVYVALAAEDNSYSTGQVYGSSGGLGYD